MVISLIVAADEQNAIGINNSLLCHLPADLRFFKQTTSGHHIIMGRKTYESIGRPLPNRVNIIISSNPELQLEGCITTTSLENALEIAESAGEQEVFITGGGMIYKQALGLAHRIYLTRIHHSFHGDTFFPTLRPEWVKVKSERHEADEKNDYAYSFEIYEQG